MAGSLRITCHDFILHGVISFANQVTIGGAENMSHMRLYQKQCAGVNSGFEDFGDKKLEFRNSLYVFVCMANRQLEEIEQK